MRNLVTLVAVIALAVPAFAQTVDITVTDDGSGVFTISYANATDDISGVSMLVTLTVGDGALVDPNADGAGQGDFNTHIDYWNAAGGTPVLGVGSPVGHATQAGMPPAGTQVFAISTGVLKDPPGGSAAAGGDIATITLGCSFDTTVTLSADTAGRGGIVDINGTELVPNFPAPLVIACGTVECLKATDPGYAFWAANGMPDCWCYRKQCKGDFNGLPQGPFWVASFDLDAFRLAFNQGGINSAPHMCSDYNHTPQGPFRVASFDLDIFRINFNQGGLADCDMTHINFWTN